jgi:AcrR family transcriptional regulator
MMTASACRGESVADAQSLDERQLAAMVDSLMPTVATATGMEFKRTPKTAVRTREQVGAYLLAKLDQELPPARLDGIVTTYRLLGLLSDTLDVKKLFIDLYTEQVAGFYDPDSLLLFAVAGGDKAQLRLVLAHELVHALQHQYAPLDSILKDNSDADRQAAAQAVLEGQATLASLVALLPGQNLITDDGFWETFREQLRVGQAGMDVFAKAPLILREGLTFPYVQGAEWMRWFMRNREGKQPFGALLPTSTEQILHPERYASGDQPFRVRFVEDSTGVLHEDTFGEFEIAVLRSSLVGINEVPTQVPFGWGGDRMRLYANDGGAALVWVSVWDEPRSADRFRTQIADRLARLPRAGYRTAVEALMVGEKSAVRIVVAPTGWVRWNALPGVELR